MSNTRNKGGRPVGSYKYTINGKKVNVFTYRRERRKIIAKEKELYKKLNPPEKKKKLSLLLTEQQYRKFYSSKDLFETNAEFIMRLIENEK